MTLLASTNLASDFREHFSFGSQGRGAAEQLRAHRPRRLTADKPVRQLKSEGAAQKYTQLDHIPDTFVGDLECSLTSAGTKGKVLVSGHQHKKGAANDCRQACRFATGDLSCCSASTW